MGVFRAISNCSTVDGVAWGCLGCVGRVRVGVGGDMGGNGPGPISKLSNTSLQGEGGGGGGGDYAQH